MKNMKMNKVTILLALTPFAAFSQEKSIKLNATLPSQLNGQKVTMMYGDFKKMRTDSARVSNGQVSFSLPASQGQIVHLNTGTKVPMDNIRLYLADTNVQLDTKDSLKNATVKGNELTEDFSRMTAPINAVYQMRMAYMRQYYALTPAQKKEEKGLALNEKMQQLSKQEKQVTYQMIDENPKSYIALHLLKTLAAGTVSYDEMMPHFEKLDGKIQATEDGQALKDKIMLVKGLRSGLVAHDFESTTPDGKRLKLSELLPKAKYTFIDFWASWCAPCRAENPNVVKAYNEYKEKGLAILSVSLDTKGDLWKAAIQKDGMPWMHVSQLKGFDEPAAVLYGIKAIPQNVLIDANGKIVATNLRGYALEEKLKQLM